MPAVLRRSLCMRKRFSWAYALAGVGTDSQSENNFTPRE